MSSSTSAVPSTTSPNTSSCYRRAYTTTLPLTMKNPFQSCWTSKVASSSFSTSTSIKSTSISSSILKLSGAFLGTCLFLTVVSDPSISSLEEIKDDVNESYWMMEYQKKNQQQQDTAWHVEGKKGCRLRNAHMHSTSTTTTAAATHALPAYARVVIVGGGMAGLHTALALAERMHDPSCQDANPPNKKRLRKSFWKRRQHPSPVSSDVIVLDASSIGNGASGRAKGLVVPGFQVPLEDLQMNAHDADSPISIWSSVPSILRCINNVLGIESAPRYSKEVAKQMYDSSYVALDRLRDIVERYEIDCDWVESGAVEASIHEVDECGEDDVKEDECQLLTAKQLNEIMGRSTTNETNNDGLYKWGEFDPNCAGVNPLALTIGLADAVERWGVKVFEYTKVDKLETKRINSTLIHNEQAQPQSKGKYTLTTENGHTIHCDHVVLCTGAEKLSNGISKRLSNAFVPIYTWMAATVPLYEECPLKDGIVNRVLRLHDGDDAYQPAPMCGDDHVSLNYWRSSNSNRKNEGRILFGSLADTYSLPTWMISWRLRNALTEVYPHLNGVGFEYLWGGKLAFPLNSMPLIGRDVDYDGEGSAFCNPTEGGVWYATGFGGHGIVPTALAGSIISNGILGISDLQREASSDNGVKQQWEEFQTYFPPSSWNGYPFSRLSAGALMVLYNACDWLGKKGVPLPPLPKLW